MNTDQFTNTVMELPVWDTHTHLDTSEFLSAQTFWDIAPYFWYRRELEGLSALRSTLIASDARCIEWFYIKITYVKRLLAGFLHQQIERGWVDEETALYAARSWLYDTAAEIYARPTP